MINFDERDHQLFEYLAKEPYVTKLGGLVIDVSKDVFPPDLGFTSKYLGKVLKNYTPNSALDMGCGSGYLAMVLRKNGVPSVWAVDHHLPAIKCTKLNIKQNNLVGIKVLQSDLFSAFPKSIKFDLVVFNQPYYPEQKTIFGMGQEGGKKIIQKFLKAVKKHLGEKGIIIMPFSEMAGEENNPCHIARWLGYTGKTIFKLKNKYGEHYIYELRLENKKVSGRIS